MTPLFSASASFPSLSLKDLVEARNLFHYNLINKKNVVATAVGLYRIRKDDAWPSAADQKPGHTESSWKRPRRTLFNSEIRPYSWPCIYAFVSNWEEEQALAASSPSDVVPKTLYLPDGRAVPVCIIEARQQPWAKDMQIGARAATARNVMSPGAALINQDGQGLPRLATAGCIVRDGERFYVMTNHHAVGPRGAAVLALQGNRSARIGVTADKGIDRVDFASVYPNFPSLRQRLLMDVGLIDLDDVLAWKTAIPGISPVGPVLDLYDNSLNLRLLGMSVVGQSAVSGLIRGEIQGLFYRYKAMGGFEYISDFLIGPETKQADGTALDPSDEGKTENKAFSVHHGDSGTLLLLEHQDEATQGAPAKISYLPFALLWGKEEFFQDGQLTTHPFALATCLSTALDRLNLDYVSSLDSDQPYVWGWVGHYIIGRNLGLPQDSVTSEKLAKFIEVNADSLAVDPNEALSNDPRVQLHPEDAAKFVPLSDVPDNVWKSNVNFTMEVQPDGTKKRKVGPGSRGQNDNPNHFADLDLPYLEGKTFLELNLKEPEKYLLPSEWVKYYAAQKPLYDKWAALLGEPNKGSHWGALPFRVHQLYDAMVAALATEKTEKDGSGLALFLTAGGVLIHYMGDACQPLHTSYMSQGDPAKVVKRVRSDKMMLEADGVHGGYEDEMIAYGYQNGDLAKLLAAEIKRQKKPAAEKIAPIKSGYDASVRVIQLIAATQADIAPREIVDKWVELRGSSKNDKSAAMWEQFGKRTVTCMARGTRYLAAIWQAAWTQGEGDKLTKTGKALDQDTIMGLYNNFAIVRSIALDKYPEDPAADWSML